MKQVGIPLMIAYLVSSTGLLSQDFKLFPEPVLSNAGLGFSTFTLAIPPAGQSFAIAGPTKPYSELSRSYFGAATSTRSLKKDSFHLRQALVSGDDATRLQALRSAAYSADRVTRFLAQLRPLVNSASNRPAAEAVIKDAKETLAAYVLLLEATAEVPR